MKQFGKIGLWMFAAVCICTGWLLFAQSRSSDNKKATPNKNTSFSTIHGPESLKVDELLGLARNAPPEITADALLTIASSVATEDKERAIALIDEAFNSADRVREAVKKKSSSRQVDSRAGFKEAAANLQLDRISLQSRAVTKMISLDRFRAREMFGRISIPAIDTLTCEDPLIEDLNPYYQAMQSVAVGCFTDKEKAAGLAIEFLAEGIAKIKSIIQVIPALKLIVEAKASREELILLAQAMTRALGRVSEDPRSFAFAIERGPFVSAANQLVSKLKEANVPATDLINGIRSLLIRNLSGEVCADVGWIKDGTVSMPRAVDSINGLFARPITLDEIRPSRIGPRANHVLYWSTPKATALMDAAKALRFSDGTSPLSTEQREAPEWRQKLFDFLDLLAKWDSASEPSEDDYFQQRCNMYNLLVEICPNDAQRDIVLRQYASYLKETSATYKGRMEWVLPVRDYLRALQTKDESTRIASLDPWLSSSDATLQLYGRLAMFRRFRD